MPRLPITPKPVESLEEKLQRLDVLRQICDRVNKKFDGLSDSQTSK